MSWNGAGVFNRIYSWVADKNAGLDIIASRVDTDTDDITSNGFGNTLTRDGQGSATANLPMNGFKHTGAANGVAVTDYATMGQLQGASAINWGVATGTSDVIAVAYAPALTALVDGQLCYLRAAFTNATTTPTFSPNGLTAHVITKTGGNALAIGDIPGALAECILRYNAANTRWELLDPASQVTGYAGETATVTITIAAPGVITWANHGLPANAQVEFSTTGALPTGLSPATPYFVVQSSITTNTFQVSATKGGVAITTTGTQSGVHTGISSTLAGNLAAFSSSSGTTLKDGGPALWGAPNLLLSAIPFGSLMLNGTIVQSQAGGAQTFALKTLAGGDPSPADPVTFMFGNNNPAIGNYTPNQVTSPLSITIPSGATLGTANATPARIWILAFNISGSVVLGVVNCLSGTTIYPLTNYGVPVLATTTLNAGSLSALVVYTAVAGAGMYVPIGYATWESGSTIGTAGNWNVAPTRIRLHQIGMPMPGDVVQQSYTQNGANTSTANTYALSNTAPTPAGGAVAAAAPALTPSSTANLVEIEGRVLVGNNSLANATAFIHDGTNTKAVSYGALQTTNGKMATISVTYMAQASAVTYSLYYSGDSGNTVINGQGVGAPMFATLGNTFIRVREIMA